MYYTVKNYKCFGEEMVEIGPFKDINVVIGKNNSGKSSVIDIVKYLIDNNEEFISSTQKGNNPEINSFLTITKEAVDDFLDKSTLFKGQIEVYKHHLMQLIGHTVKCFEMGQQRSIIESNIEEIDDSTFNILQIFVRDHESFFFNKNFVHISAERDVQPEVSRDDLYVSSNGYGVTNFVQKIINDRDYDSRIIESLLLSELNKITNPDMVFKRILVQVNKEGLWEIFLEDELNTRVSLSKMGSGIKTILLVIILVKIQPYIKKGDYKDCVFALEELENNLHPSQQRRLYNYLYEFSKVTGAKFIITTHSNIVIDLYSKYENAQIMHVCKNNGESKIKTISDPKSIASILDDLSIKASDILQSNSIIWVEGPSDRTFINHWINLVDPSLIEGYHYSIMFYGGKLLSNLTIDYEALENDLIQLIRLNRNCLVVMDRDGESDQVAVNSTKKRIVNELNDSRAWITKGREIENYLTKNTLTKWLAKKHNYDKEFHINHDQKIDKVIESELGESRLKYAKGKNKYANEIVEFISFDDLDILDLKAKIELIVSIIKQCNK